MCVSMAVCLFICCLILYFLFPRSVTLLPVSVQSVMVYFTPETVEMGVKVKEFSHLEYSLHLCFFAFVGRADKDMS